MTEAGRDANVSDMLTCVHEKHLKRQERLLDATRKVLAQKDLMGLLQTAADAARELTGAKYAASGHGYVNGVFTTGGASHSEGAMPCPPGKAFNVDKGGVYLDLIQEKDSIRFTDVEMRSHPAWWGLPEGHVPLHGLLGSRLVDVNGQPNGLLMVSGKEDGGDFTSEDENTLSQLASIVSLAQQHIEARLEAENEKRRLEAIMKALPVGVSFSDDPSCQSIIGNPAVRAQFDVRPEDNLSASAPNGNAPGRQVRYFMDGRQITDAELPLQRAVTEKCEIPPIELKVELPNGRQWYAEASGAPILDAKGNVIGGVAVTVDITERKQAEEALIKSEKQLKHIIENSLDVAYRRDLRTDRFDYISPVIENITGFSVDEMMAMSSDDMVERVHPDDLDIVYKNFDRTLRGGHCVIEYRFKGKDGNYRWIADSINVLADSQGNPIYRIGVVRDIAERKRAEESEERLRALMDHNPSLVFLKDESGRYVYLNKAYERQFALSKDWYGKTDFDFWPKESAELFRINDSVVLKSGQIHQFIEDSTDLEGIRHCWHCYKFPFVDSKNERYLGGIGIDATDRMRAEEALRLAYAQLQIFFDHRIGGIGIVIANARGGILQANDYYLSILGCSREELLSGQVDWLEITPPEWLPADERALAQLRERGVCDTYEKEYLRRDGTRVPVLITDVMMPGDSDNILAFVLDITERKRAEDALQKSQEQYRSVVENTSAIILRVNPRGFITFANRRALEFFGYEADEMIGKHAIVTIVPSQETTGRDLAAMVDEIALTPDRFHSNANENICKDGRRVWMEWTNSGIYDDDGKLKEFLSVGIDATDRKQAEEALKNSEEKYRQIVQTAQEGIWMIDGEDRTTFINQKMADMLGYSAEEMLGRSPKDFMGQEFLEIADERLHDHKHGTNHFVDYRFIKKDGTDLWCILSSKAFFDHEGTFAGSLAMITDITERKRAEEALQKQAVLIDLSPDSIMTIQLNGTINFWSQGAQSLYGWTKEEAIGQQVHTLLQTHFPQPLEQLVEQVQQAGYWSGELIHSTKDSRQVIVQSRWQAKFDDQGNVSEILESNVDITERKKAEEAVQEAKDRLEIRVKERTEDLEEANARLQEEIGERKRAEEALKTAGAYNRSLIEASLDSLVTIGPDGKITDVNAATEAVTGHSREELIGTDFSNYFTEPDKARNGYQQVFKDGSVFDYALEIRRCDGYITPVLYNASVYRNEVGDIVGVFAAARDISAQKQAAQYARSLIESSLDPLVTISADGKITDVNEATVKETGIPREQLIGTDFSNYFTEPEKAREGYQIVFAKGLVTDYPLTIKCRDGRLTDVLYNASIYKDISGNVAGVFAAARDITERKKAEEELLKAKDAAEEAVRAKAAFLANMSHEIRTPMNSVIGFTELLLDEPESLSPEQGDNLEHIRINGNALLTIINDILDFSKMESDKLVLEDQTFNLRSCVEESLDLVSVRASEKSLNLSYTIDKNVPDTIIGDPGRIRQVLGNLLSNAVKFTDEGEVTVSVSVPADGTNEVHFSIQDTGIGIPQDNMNQLFQPFTQMEPSTTRLYGGTGLGLAISKKLVELMNGKIWAESQEGVGSTFHFTIRAPSGKVSPEPAVISPQLIGKSMLIVVDNRINRRLLSKQVYDWGMVPVPAGSGQEALRWISRGDNFDIAILDMDLQDMDSLGLEEQIHKYSKTLPLVLLTSLGHGVPPNHAYLTKPIKPAQLHKVLTEILPGTTISSDQPLSRQTLSGQPLPSQPDKGLAKPSGYDKPIQNKPLRILLAEDNISSQKVALMMLKKLGYKADAAANGIEALQSLERQHYDVVLMDLKMPEMDGLEATRIIRQRWPHDGPKIIAITAYALEGDREKCLEAGMDDYIAKPILKEDLARALKDINRL